MGLPGRRLHLAPGKLIDIGGDRLHVHCVGPIAAKPTVVFEAGGGAFSKDWAAVQSLLASRFRTCGYDRAGLGWSELGPAPRTMRQEVFELDKLLSRPVDLRNSEPRRGNTSETPGIAKSNAKK
jgi:pimeloyl-ACP methyl ester carboxylesterase